MAAVLKNTEQIKSMKKSSRLSPSIVRSVQFRVELVRNEANVISSVHCAKFNRDDPFTVCKGG